MTTIEFQAWAKIPRLNRDMIITEKIDGTNAAVGIVRVPELAATYYDHKHPLGAYVEANDSVYLVYAQSRKKIITPEQDNAGFARYVRDNAEALVTTLGEGLHFGEWWGSGIQRGYGLEKGEKRFSLFNTPRYDKFDLSGAPPNLGVVPTIYTGPFSSERVMYYRHQLAVFGSWAAPGFKDPEGLIVFHVAAQMPFKVTILNDEKPKGSVE